MQLFHRVKKWMQLFRRLKKWMQLFEKVDEQVDEKVDLARPRGTAKPARLAGWWIVEASFARVFPLRQEAALLEGHERPWLPHERLFCCRKGSFITTS